MEHNLNASIEDQLKELQRANRKLTRENIHLKNAITQEKLAYTTVLNQQKASTFIQRERERYLALLLANSPSIILFLNQAGRVEFCTDYFIEMAGYSNPAAVLGHRLAEVLAPFMDDSTLEVLLSQTQHVTQTNLPLALDSSFHFANDNFDFAGLIVPMTDEAQTSNGVMLIFHDVTILKRSREEALVASQAKTNFLSNMSHEIRTPLNAITGLTSIGKRDSSLQGKNKAFAKIETASAHLLGIINDVLDISKIEAGKMELSPVDFDFVEMLSNAVSVISVRMDDKQQKFTLCIDPSIPHYLHGDDRCLAQVITNILSNASKFTAEHGEITLTATQVGVQDSKHILQISVKDSGIGMTETEQSKLFNIFQQAEADTSRKFGGSGLGLAISKHLLELMGGRIWVKSEKGNGSEFIFTVNLADPNTNKVVATDVECSMTYEADFTGKTVLVVDDIEINLEIASLLLAETNLQVDTAVGGRQAVHLFAQDPMRYDLIFMDMQMPEVDGLQATRMIRTLDIDRADCIPIIAMTANVFREDIEKCLAAGMNGHLGKPLDMSQVLKVLANYLSTQ